MREYGRIVFENLNHAAADHRIHIKPHFYGMGICFETVAAFADTVSDTKLHAGAFIRDTAVYIHKDDIRFSDLSGIQVKNHLNEFFLCLAFQFRGFNPVALG